ncbi:MAG: division/cell wall cluster transcriptional repressor MraZ [Ruminococcaceae bacterium]|nr:division/cell wall cluster transcriptional repressor MraZ [Oscillospiraceae bacterium]
MLTGEYFHNVDAKGRMNFPSKLREELGEKFYITRWLDDCLAAFSEEEWEVICDRIKSLPLTKSRDVQRFFFANAAQVEPDKQGRILIPQNLRERSGINKEVAIIGVLNRAEIWDRERWLQKSEEMDADMFDDRMLELDI